MMAAIRQLASLPAALAAASAGLAGTVALQLSRPPEVPPPPAGAAATVSEPAALGPPEAYEPRPLESYRGIAERPLFAPSRRPVPGPGAAAAGRTVHETLMLAGVILTTSKRLAMLETKRASGGVVVVREGQVVEGWSVESIAADRVVISHNGQIVELLLDDRLKAPRKEVRRTPQTAPKPPPPQPQAQPKPEGEEQAPADGESAEEEPADQPEGSG